MSIIVTSNDTCYHKWMSDMRKKWMNISNTGPNPTESPTELHYGITWEKLLLNSAKDNNATILEFVEEDFGMIGVYLEFKEERYHTAFVLKYS